MASVVRVIPLLAASLAVAAAGVRCGGSLTVRDPATSTDAGAEGESALDADLDADVVDLNLLCQERDAICLGPLEPFAECGEFLFHCTKLGAIGSCCYPSECYLAGGNCGYVGCPDLQEVDAFCPQGGSCCK